MKNKNVIKEKDKLKLSSSKQQADGLFQLALSLVKPYRKWLVVIFIAMVVETLMSLAAVWPLKIIIDNVIQKHKLPNWMTWAGLNLPDMAPMKLAALAAVCVVIIAIIKAVASYIDNYLTESVAQYVANDLRQKIYHHLQRLSLPYFDTHQTGTMLSSITDDVSTIQGFASSALLGMLIDALTILGMVTLMFYLNWDFTLIAVGITPFLLFFVGYFKRAVKKATHEVRSKQTQMFTVIQQGLESERAVKAFGREALEEDKLKVASLEAVRSSLKARKIKSFLSPVVNVVVAICLGIVLWRGASLVMAGVMTIGSLTVFIAYLNKFFNPVEDLAKMTNSIAQATVALERVQAILITDQYIAVKADAKNVDLLKGDIEFDHIAFGYDDEKPVLKDVHFAIRAGESVGICGPTGSGKSTVVSLIPRFYDPSAGSIRIDGVAIDDYVLKDLRSQIGFVLQDTVLFYGTIRDNIAYGRPDATEDEIREAAKLALADEFISDMPHGYDTQVGERGVTLSGGQRQRIGIARAIVRNSPILILDEPTSALDSESEKLVMQALENLMKGKTVITIAHRLSTIRNANKIVVLKDGVVAEQGSHEELIAKNQIYADLYKTQMDSPPVTAVA